jgi:hypothetical protein
LLFDDRTDGRGVKGADGDHHKIVGHVARPIVGQQVIARGGGKHIAIADDGVPIRMLPERGGKQVFAEPVIGIVLPHVDLAQDDVAFARHLAGGQRGVQDDVGKEIDGHGRVFGGQVDVINGAIEGGVGIDVAAQRLDAGGNLTAGATRGALEQHVFEIMGETRAELRPLMNAAGFHPHLHGGDRGSSIALEQNGEPVGKNQALGRITPKTLEQGEIAGGGTHGRTSHRKTREGGKARETRVSIASVPRSIGQTDPTISVDGPVRRVPAGWNGFTNASPKS